MTDEILEKLCWKRTNHWNQYCKLFGLNSKHGLYILEWYHSIANVSELILHVIWWILLLFTSKVL